MTAFGAYVIGAFCCAAIGCSTPVSKILVSWSEHRDRDLAAARAACESVAARHGLALKPPEAWPPGFIEYAKRLPPFGFDGPSIVFSGIDSQYAAVITVAGEGTTDRGRREIASETCLLLQKQLGKTRITCFDTQWTDF